MVKVGWTGLGVLRAVLGSVFLWPAAGAWAAPGGLPSGRIAYRARNIDWGAVEVSDVTRERRAGRLSASAAETVETRTLRLANGRTLRVRERLEPNAAGGEDRVYVGGEKLDEIRVCAADGAVESVRAALRETGCTLVARYGRTGGILRARLPPTDDAGRAAILARLEACGGAGAVRAALSPMRFYQACAGKAAPAAAPDDPLFAHQWHLGRIGATNVWAQGFFGYPNVPCAVFDTGVHVTHEDLRDNVRARVSALRSSPDPEDHHGHGSHCLGIMGADSNNGRGVCGVGQVANLTSIRGPISYGTAEDDILDGFQYALDHGIRVLSCSFGSPAGTAYYDEAECAMIGELGRGGCLVVIAAGNDGNDNDRVPAYPAAYTNDNIITVIASNKRDAPVSADSEGWNTCYGATSCDIAAPGTDILSCTKEGDGSYESWEGTSMATPIVSACAAMVWERNPSWTYREVRDRLLATAAPSGALAGYCATGARVDLAAALNQRYTLSVEPLAKRAYDTGEPVRLALRASAGVGRVAVALARRDDGSFARALGEFDVAEGENELSVWTPGAADVARGYLLRVSGVGEAAEAHANSSVFRVREAGVAETIAVTAPAAGSRHDAAELNVAFTASSAVYADLAIEHQTEDGGWLPDTTLGLVACAPGEAKHTQVELKGRGWPSERPYRIVVTDNDDPSVRGYSAPFYFDRSSLAVWLLADDGWTNGTWEVGREKRLECYLPQTDLYWLLLIDDESGAAIILKETWTDITDPVYKQRRFFGLTIPESVGMTNALGEAKRYHLQLVDAFDMTMFHESPSFTLVPRSDGLAEPPLDVALGDGTAHEFSANGQWYPERTPDGGWQLRCGYVGPGESAYFETDVSGPVTVRYGVLPSALPGTLRVQRAKAPILKSTEWYDVPADGLVPAGDWRLRWTYARTDASSEGDAGKGPAVANLQFLVTMPTVRIATDGGVLRITGAQWPTNIVYTLDGSEPTKDSPRWVDGMNRAPYAFRLDRSMRIRARAYLEGTVPGVVAAQDYFHPGAVIATPFDLAAFAASVLAGNDYAGQTVTLAGDLDMSGVPMQAIGWRGMAWDAVQGYTSLERPFAGTFDGGGHTVAHVTLLPTTVSGEEPLRGLFGWLSEAAVVRDLVLADADGPALADGSQEDCRATFTNVAVTDVPPAPFAPAPFAPPDYRAYGIPSARAPRLFCNEMPVFDGDETYLTRPLEDLLVDRTEADGPWTVRYTLDGGEPSEADAVLPARLVIPGQCVIRARVFAAPWYAPGEAVTVSFVCDWNEETKAAQTLAVVGGRVVKGENYTEELTVRADAAPAGQRFSHWKVTGPLALEDYRANPLVFRLMTREPLVLEAVYRPVAPFSVYLY